MMKLQDLLRTQITYNASDLIIKFNSPPIMRIAGELRLLDLPPLTKADIETGIVALLTKDQIAEYKRTHELDISYEMTGGERFRVNLFKQRGNLGGVFRLIPSKIPTLNELGFPPILKEIALRPRGLIVVTGPSGCGKTTTQAALINHRNENDTCHIVTVEDPIEFIHTNKQALITQREIGRDTHSFANALKFVLRQDPDVILVGEMRDLETISLAITAAETGHIVITTLHTSDAISTIDRIIDVFPPHQQNQVRMQISLNLLCVVSQNLFKRIDGKGRIAVYEVLNVIPSVRNLIREAKSHQISSILQTSHQQGMISFDACLATMVKKKIITREEAEKKALNPDTFHKEMEQLSQSK